MEQFFPIFRRTIIALTITFIIVVQPSVSNAQPSINEALTTNQRLALEGIIRNFILKNPEIVSEALLQLRENERMAKAKAEKNVLVSNHTAIYSDPSSPVGGNPNGDVSVIEFFDYGCGVCKRIHPIVEELIKTDRGIRRIYKEWPILGPDSVRAARAAIASRQQNKYSEFHNVLMTEISGLSESAIMAKAKSVGINTRQLKREMNNPKIDKIIRQNYTVAEKLKLNGTPAFVIGDKVIRGGLNLESLRAIVKEVRANNKGK
ncbi:MAG: DsbA family protein [Pseudomonadota bacterium]|nr:DsbA family protein [Pseudomonadota bacterium]